MDNPVRSANAEWTWLHSGIQQVQINTIEDPLVKKWVEETLHNQHSCISAVSLEGDERRRLSGTIIFFPKPYNPEIKQFLHYYVTGDMLITIGMPRMLYETMGQFPFEERLLSWGSPIEALIYIAALIIEHYFEWMDQFEQKLMKAKVSMRRSNGGHLFRYIMDLRFNLIQSSDQMNPLKELRYAAVEVFGHGVNESSVFNVLQLRLKRVHMLQSGYKSEIDSLLKLDEATINYRGNDIIKTLTVFTVLLTPMTALGAVWGMNFEHMPEIDWRWGYPAALALMFLCMGGIYWYLRKQGWTGKILDMKDVPSRKNNAPFLLLKDAPSLPVSPRRYPVMLLKHPVKIGISAEACSFRDLVQRHGAAEHKLLGRCQPYLMNVLHDTDAVVLLEQMDRSGNTQADMLRHLLQLELAQGILLHVMLHSDSQIRDLLSRYRRFFKSPVQHQAQRLQKGNDQLRIPPVQPLLLQIQLSP